MWRGNDHTVSRSRSADPMDDSKKAFIGRVAVKNCCCCLQFLYLRNQRACLNYLYAIIEVWLPWRSRTAQSDGLLTLIGIFALGNGAYSIWHVVFFSLLLCLHCIGALNVFNGIIEAPSFHRIRICMHFHHRTLKTTPWIHQDRPTRLLVRIIHVRVCQKLPADKMALTST